MKRYLLLLPLLLALVACGVHLTTPQQLGQSLFAALRAGSGDDFAACCLTAADIDFLDTKVRLSRPENPTDYTPLADLKPELPPRYVLTFEDIRTELADFAWGSASLARVEQGEQVVADWVPPGVFMLEHITLFLDDGTCTYSLRLYDIVKVERGWLVSNPIYRLQKETR